MAKNTTKRPPGRPKLPAAERRRNFISMRLRDDTKARLEDSARRNQRSLSEEIEAKLETALSIETGINEGLSLKYGPAAAGLLRLMGEAMMEAGFHVAHQTTQRTERLRDWPLNPAAFEAAKQASVAVLDSVAPAYTASDAEQAGVWGRSMAKAVLSLLKDPTGAPLYEKDNREIAEMLGPLFERITITGRNGQ